MPRIGRSVGRSTTGRVSAKTRSAAVTTGTWGARCSRIQALLSSSRAVIERTLPWPTNRRSMRRAAGLASRHVGTPTPMR